MIITRTETIGDLIIPRDCAMVLASGEEITYAPSATPTLSFRY